MLKRETWHPRQTLEEHGDEVVLTVPYTNPTELIGDIFRWREHVSSRLLKNCAAKSVNVS